MNGVPWQVFTVGVTVTTAVAGTEAVFVPVNAGTFPVPLAARPIAVFALVQSKVPPAGLLLNAVAGTNAPLQAV